MWMSYTLSYSYGNLVSLRPSFNWEHNSTSESVSSVINSVLFIIYAVEAEKDDDPQGTDLSQIK